MSTVTSQQLIDAARDVSDLSAFVNGDVGQTVLTRLGKTLRTLADLAATGNTGPAGAQGPPGAYYAAGATYGGTLYLASGSAAVTYEYAGAEGHYLIRPPAGQTIRNRTIVIVNPVYPGGFRWSAVYNNFSSNYIDVYTYTFNGASQPIPMNGEFSFLIVAL